MLKEFSVKNFKSILNETLFTMEACPASTISEFPEHIINIGDERLLKVASIYGPNGSGKSNLLEALYFFVGVSIARGSMNDSPNDNSYFSSIYSKSKNTEFTLFFITDKYEIGYKLIVDVSGAITPNDLRFSVDPFAHKIADRKIIYELCSYREIGKDEYINVYERNEYGIVSSNMLNFIDVITNRIALNSNITFLRYFQNTFNNMISSSSEGVNVINELIGQIKSIDALPNNTTAVLFDEDFVKEFIPKLPKLKEWLNNSGIIAKDIEFRKSKDNSYSLFFLKDEKNKDLAVPLQMESIGTKKITLYFIKILSNEGNAIYVCDDLDSLLHPKLISALITLFNSSENKDKQFIFNSQDLVNMNNKLFRRDEIWLCCFENYSSKYIPLSNIVDYKGKMIRKDAIYGKQYLEGRYGCDPIIRKALNWEDNKND